MKFIVVRYAPGASGKFISTLLQLSPDVNPWYPQLHQKQVLSWFKTKFSMDFANWLKHEPEVPYQTAFVSNRFGRGDSVDLHSALEYLREDFLFQTHWNNDKKICLILNKSRVPDWIKNNCSLVNVVIDSQHSRSWINRCRLQKQFLRQSVDTWIIKQDHPDFCNPARSVLARQFKNPGTYTGRTRDFVKKYIYDDELSNLFMDSEKITADPSNLGQSQIYLNHSDIIDTDRIVGAVIDVCQQLNIRPPSADTVEHLAHYYQQLHCGILPRRLHQ